MLKPHRYASDLLGLGLNDTNSDSKSNGWKGKKVISFEQWNKITRLEGIQQGLEFFPNEYHEHIFLGLGVPDNFREEANAWHKNYIELMDFSKNPKYGKRKCRDCLLSPNNEGSYFGLYKFIANALKVEQSNYPCKVVNFFSCPYDDLGINESSTPPSRSDLFSLSQIVQVIGRALSKALNIKGTRIIYKIDFESGNVQEIDTFLCCDKDTQDLPGGKPIEHTLKEISERIEKLSSISMRNVDDIFTILTNQEKLDIVLQIGLDKEYIQDKDKLIEFFMSIKGNVKKDDLSLRNLLTYYLDKNKCSICSQPANINCINGTGDNWICMNHLKKGK
jgi:hypothetical protein